MTNGEYIALAALGFNILLALLAVVFGRSAIRSIVSEEVARHKDDVTKALTAMTQSKLESEGALKDRIHELETWTRDQLATYVRRDTFNLVMAETRAGIKDLVDGVTTRLGRIEAILLQGRS